jgi:menaquinone-dependent protoporphyrinogen oxidase
MSKNKTLLAYMTKGGATEEAARTIVGVLRSKFSLEVDLVNLRKQPSPDIAPYNNVIVGSGVRTGKIYKEALRLLEQDFEGKKVAFFICFSYLSSLKTSLPSEDDKLLNRDQVVERYIKTALADYPKVKPVFVGATNGCLRVFGKAVTGAIDAAKTGALAEELGKRLVE